MITRRDFIKSVAAGVFALNAIDLLPVEKVFAADNLSVKTRYGTFNGFIDKNGVKTWLGIPYAQPPVKNLRWQAPQPLKPSNKSFDTKKFGNAAIKVIDDTQHPQSEDCLTLNIWKRGEKKNLPVMFFIHGGAFAFESSSDSIYNGSNFAAANDVVIVTFNYRLNVFGFLNLASVDSSFENSGYLGTIDQVAALKWVKENIAEFGGNPDNITIFGESAGSISCMLLTVAPNAKGLFNKAIPQSGSLFLYVQPENSAKITKMFMEMSGAKNVSDLMKKSSDELKIIYAKFAESRGFSLMDFFPTCDGKFLPSNPVKALKDGGARGIKLLTGTTADEWRAFLLADENFLAILRENPKNNSPALSRYKKQTPQEIYKSWRKNRPDNNDTYGDFATQLDWRVSQELTAEYQSKFEDVYYYLFSQQSPIENLRSCHAVDLPFTFNNPDYFEQNPNPTFSKIIQTTWTAFATTGNPDNELLSHWEKYSANNRQTMELNSKGCVLHKDLNTQNLNELRHVYED